MFYYFISCAELIIVQIQTEAVGSNNKRIFLLFLVMESKKRTKKIKDTQKLKEISKVAEEDNGETVEMQAENSLVRFTYFVLNVTEFPKVERLLKKSELSEGAIRSQYRSFMSICPDGVMSREKFLQLAEVLESRKYDVLKIIFCSKFLVTRPISSSTRCLEYSMMTTAAPSTSRSLYSH